MKASLRDGKIRLSLHCSKLTHESKTYPPLDISVTYAVNVQDGMFVLVREGGVEILPSDFDPTVKKRLPASIVSLRRVMGKRLQEVFKDEVEIKEVPVLKMPEMLRQVSPNFGSDRFSSRQKTAGSRWD